MQEVAGATKMEASLTNWNLVLRFCNRWQIEVCPAFLLKKMTNKVTQVQPLHDYDDGVGGLVVQAAEQRVRVPLLGAFAGCFRIGILRLERIVDDNEVAAAAGEGATDRGGQPVATAGGGKFQFSVLDRTNPSLRKQAIVEGRAHEGAAVVGMLAGQSLSIADTDDPPCRVVAENEGGEYDRRTDRLEATRWHRDDQALGLALKHPRQRKSDGLDMPVWGERRTGRDDRKGRLYKAIEVFAKDGSDDFLWIVHHDF